MANTKPVPAQATAPVSNKPVWTCKIETPPRDEKGFTVGEVFELECTGTSVALKEPLKLNLPKNAEYSIVLLNPGPISENKVNYRATAYRAGDLKFQNLDVVDAEGHGFIIDKLDVQVQSVMDPKKPQEEPFGPVLPYTMSWPAWVFIAPVVVVLVMLAWFMIFLRRRLQKKLLEKNIKKFLSPLGSYHQFSKDLRALKRSVIFSAHQEWAPEQVTEFLQKLDESYRLFILREFIVPATTWRVAAITSAVKKKDPVGFEKYKNIFLKAFKELERAQSNPTGLKAADCEQLTQICWQAVDLIWKSKSTRSRDEARGAT